jgi:hypothetical protein
VTAASPPDDNNVEADTGVDMQMPGDAGVDM